MKSPESPMRRPPTYQEYKSLGGEISGNDLAHYYNNELVSLTSIGERLKLKVRSSALDEDQKDELIQYLDRVMNGLSNLHEIANDAFVLMEKKA